MSEAKCSKCGSTEFEEVDGQIVCKNCGEQFNENDIVEVDSETVDDKYEVKDKPSFILNFVSFFSSLWALVIWLVLYNDKPHKAHSAGKAGVVGWIIKAIIVIIILIIYYLIMEKGLILSNSYIGFI